MKIYHNPRCSKSRQTLELIQQAGQEPEIIEYLQEPPDAEELENILELLGMEPQELMRTGESVYRELGLAQRALSRAEAIRVLVENPQLIQRPIVVAEHQAVIGRPPSNVVTLL